VKLAVAAGIAMVVLGVLAVVTEHYTSQPWFCGSCHIMEPYYTSWKNDVHSTTKAYARCVDCHYAPGEQHTFRAKFRGISQVFSYFSGRAGAGRPKAHVNDASCLRSGCHGDRKYMATEEKLGNVIFVHAKHLDPHSEMLSKARARYAELRATLTEKLGAERLAGIDAIGQVVEETEVRDRQLTEWLAARSLTKMRDDVLAYGEQMQIEVRIAQLGSLHCASCHQFNTSLTSHFALAKTTCYTCHFINEPFNQNTGRCLSCHHPPAGPVPVHYGAGTATQPTTSAPQPVVTMDHATILANNVNCISCHADLIHGTGEVTRRDCQNCHDQARYLKDFDHLTDEVVRDYHRVHAGGQYARCNDCHRLIDHKLTPLATPGEAEALLAPVRRACQHCHPEHHRSQVEMLLGQGGYTGAARGMPNPMTGARANCDACHTQAGNDPTGELVIRGTEASCRGCHGKDYSELFEQWREEIRARLADAQSLLADVQKQLAAATQPAGRDLTEATRLVAHAKQNIQLVATAGGIHNRNYALLLLDQAVSDLRNVRKMVKPGEGTK
jgi:cytochrome c nitrite reductase small subunit